LGKNPQFNVSATLKDQSMNNRYWWKDQCTFLGSSPENGTSVLLKPEHESYLEKVEKQMVVQKADVSSTMVA